MQGCIAAARQTLLGDHISCAIGLVVQSALHRAQRTLAPVERLYGGGPLPSQPCVCKARRSDCDTEDAQKSWG
jgi:hypothetical protein